jgi:hypothetical protein
MAPEAHGGQVLPDPDYGPKNMISPTKTDLPYNFCFIKFLPSLTVEAVDAHRPCLGPPDPWFRVRARSRRSRPNHVDYREGTLYLLFNRLCLKMIDHGPRSTWGPGPSRSGLRAQKYDPPLLKQSFPTTFVFYNFCLVPRLML